MADEPQVTVEVRFLASFGARLRGLLGRPAPGAGRGVFIAPCRQVHTFGMAYAIDVAHLDAGHRVLALQTLRPYRLGRYCFRAEGVLEMRAGEAERLGIREGVRIALVRIDGS